MWFRGEVWAKGIELGVTDIDAPKATRLWNHQGIKCRQR